MAGSINPWNNQIAAANSDILLNAGVNNINMGSDSTDGTINIGTAASGGRLINIGNYTGTTSLVGHFGGNITMISADGTAIFSASTNGTTHIGSGGGTATTTIGSGSGGVDIAGGPVTLRSSGTLEVGNLSLANETINIGSNVSNAHSSFISIGNILGTSSVTLSCGSGGMKAIGIAGVSVANKNYVTINTSTGALGSDTVPAGVVTTINGDVGSATGATITFNANSFSGSSVTFNASGSTVNLDVSDSNGNTLVGFNAGNGTLSGTTNISLGGTTLHALTTGSSNTAIGYHSMQLTTTGASNSGLGSGTLTALTTGVSNTAVGYFALDQVVTGSYNTALGDSAGYNYTGAESSNINIGYNTSGTLGESHVLRIGNGTGAGNGQVNKAYIAGIDGVNVGSVAKVLTMASDQLGTSTITAGANITVTPGANTITIAANSTSVTSNYVSVNHAASPYTALATDYYISADVTGGVISILLPNAPTTGRTFVIKDKVGLAATSNITVTTVGGAVTIDGATSFVMNTAYEAISVIFNGTSYEVL